MGPAAPATAHIVGPVPVVARAAALAGILAGLLLVAARFLPYVDVGGVAVTPGHGPLDVAAALLWPGVVIAAGASVVLKRLPRLGLAVLASSGALAIGLAVGELYQLQGAMAHRAVEVFFGQRLVTTSVDPLGGVWVHLAAYLLLVVALALILVGWPRTTMEDAGDFDAARPLTMGLAAVAALVGVLAVAAKPQAAPDRIVQDATGFRTTVEVAGEVSVLDRLGLDLAGGVLLAAAVCVVALLAATLRPRLASVGALGGLASYFLSAALLLLLETGRYDDVVVAPGAVLHLLSGGAFAGLTAYCLLARRPPVAPVRVPKRKQPIRSKAVPAGRVRPRRGAPR